jgi:hypothetical protein
MRFSILALIITVAVAAPAAAQTSTPIHVPPIELAAGMTVEHKAAGGVFSLSGNLKDTFAITGELAIGPHGPSLLAGPRISTGFYYDGAPPSAGRFFAQVLIGTDLHRTTSEGPIIQPGAGADVMVVPSHGIGLHWSIDYRFAHGAPLGSSGARLVIGLLVGPHT